MNLGTTPEGTPVDLDLDSLIGSHLCAAANSGGGKSGAIRKLLEATYGRVQHIVLDAEDEFYTLRERYDYVIAGGDGDAPATVANARSLAAAALTHDFSLIAQINDLGDDAGTFIAEFLAGLLAAPRDLWRPVLVVIDEAQRFAPSGAPSESTTAMKDLLQRGRKRGFTAVLATTRLSELHAGVRGLCNNWLLGLVGQSLDRRTTADQLGFGHNSAEGRGLQSLERRQFWAFGPALTRQPTLLTIGDVETTIIRHGQARVPTPPAPEALREILAGLAKPEPVAGTSPSNAASSSSEAGLSSWATADLVDELEQRDPEWLKSHPEFQAALQDRDHFRSLAENRQSRIRAASHALGYRTLDEMDDADLVRDMKVARAVPPGSQDTVAAPAVLPNAGGDDVDRSAARATDTGSGRREEKARRPTSPASVIPASQQRVLDALAWWRSIGISPVERNRASVIAGLSPKASTFGVYISKLAAAGLVESPAPGVVQLTEAGIEIAADPGRVDRKRVVAMARDMLSPAAATVFDKIVAAYPQWIDRGTLADQCGLSRTASTLGVYISKASGLGFVETKPGQVRAAEWMMP